MKRNVLMLLIVILVIISVLLIFICFVTIGYIGNSQSNNKETFLMHSSSPNGEYSLDVYKTEPGATVDFSVKVYLTNNNQKKLIYNAYHEYEAKIDWIDDSTVIINGKVLDLSIGESYDWRRDE